MKNDQIQFFWQIDQKFLDEIFTSYVICDLYGLSEGPEGPIYVPGKITQIGWKITLTFIFCEVPLYEIWAFHMVGRDISKFYIIYTR